ncbi:MAG: CoA protein activase [Peptococcaceae bacterium]|nr:CoA protein activase [Candidatus Syntrophopropionicum ammoniitolerans]
MRVTFPHMGNLFIPVKGMLQYLGLDVVVPPPSSKKTLTIGAKYGPEFACLPFKLNLGNFVEAHEQGADTIVMAGGCGPCRFGYYAQIEHAILKDLGYDMRLIVLEPPEKHLSELLAKIRELAGNKSWWHIFQAVRFGYRKAKAVDEVEMAALWARPREITPGDTEKAYTKALKMLDKATSTRELMQAEKSADQLLSAVAVDNKKTVVKIGLVGEIYTLLDPFSNQYMERSLGRLGAEVDRSIYLSEWVNEHIFRGLARGMRTRKKACLAARPYLRHFVGGHGQESVGNAVNFAQAGYDGIIQVFPFTCMPEIVAESILPKMRADYGTPVMTIIVDEHTGEAGTLTRLEAFVDLLARKKEAKEA